MLAALLILVPAVAAELAFAVPSRRRRLWAVTFGVACHAALVCYVVSTPFPPPTLPWIDSDGLTRYFLLFITTFFLILTTYLPSYLVSNRHRSNRVLCSCLLLSLSAVTTVIVARHLAVLWIAVEATTLATARCIYVEHNPRALGGMTGVLRNGPWSGWGFVLGFFVITGAPGGGPFVNEIMVLSGAFRGGHLIAGCVLIGLLFLVVAGMVATVLRCTCGPQPSGSTAKGESAGERLPVLAALLLAIALGFHTPPFVATWIEQVVTVRSSSELVHSAGAVVSDRSRNIHDNSENWIN
ncbi:MAG: hypothetical protein H6821_10160 [Planctomycetaceae bacterium]|nr:hypothetical protein [Planctomycetales bacterium]MCB9874528.1 hypothetical protein [Planctomycetaceae bacterium]MCB9940871.1 hypothetical protein [Planctomycetaceae bacterium]